MAVVGQIIAMRRTGSTAASTDVRVRGMNLVTRSLGGGAIETPVSAVLYHGKTSLRLFSIPVNGTPLEIGDVIQTSSDTVLMISWVLGGRVGVSAGAIVTVDSERSVRVENVTLSRILFRQVGIWTKVAKQSTPVLIQTNGGVLGIKG